MITLNVNGRRQTFQGPPFKRLLDVLREDLNLTGTKDGCGEGESRRVHRSRPGRAG